jgi:Spy/CpxP family protein refolding chaperone
MQRPKQQALAFLLGAVLVGGVVGFSADRMFRQPDDTIEARRQRMYDDLGLAQAQRVALDSVFDASNCQIDALYAPLQPAYDSIKATRRLQFNAILTPEQRTRLEARRKDDAARHDAERKRIKSACHK